MNVILIRRPPSAMPVDALPATTVTATVTEQPKKKRQAFNVAKSASVRAVGARNSTDSPLLRLPSEVRQQIWMNLLGDRVFYLDWDKDNDPQYTFTTAYTYLCVDRRIEDKIHNQEYVVLEHVRQAFPLIQHNYIDEDDTIAFYETPQLQILRTCRQAYLEINPILWSTNTFTFQGPKIFKHFVSNRNSIQKTLLRQVRISIEQDLCVAWQYLTSNTMIMELRGLRVLQLYLDVGMFPAPVKVLREIGEVEMAVDVEMLMKAWDQQVNTIQPFTLAPLSEVDIVFTPSGARTSPHEMVLPAHHLWADKMKTLLLDPNALSKWKRESAELRARQKAKNDAKRERRSQDPCYQKTSERGCIDWRQDFENQWSARYKKEPKTIKKHCGRKHVCKCSDYPCEHAARVEYIVLTPMKAESNTVDAPNPDMMEE